MENAVKILEIINEVRKGHYVFSLKCKSKRVQGGWHSGITYQSKHVARSSGDEVVKVLFGAKEINVSRLKRDLQYWLKYEGMISIKVGTTLFEGTLGL